MQGRKIFFRKKYFAGIGVLLLFAFIGALVVIKTVAGYNEENEFELSAVLYGSADSTLCRVDWWIDEEGSGGGYYIFLPQNVNSKKVEWKFNKYRRINIDGSEVKNGDELNLDDGEHIVIAGGEEYKLVVMHSSPIASLFITTESGSMEYVHEDKENKESGLIALYDENGNLDYKSDFQSIKCRGNSSYTNTDKKSYTIRLSEEASILGMARADKWLLIANAFDSSKVRNAAAYDMASQLQVKYTPDYRFTDLYINGEYRGSYLLMEAIEVGENRVNIADLEKANKKVNGEIDVEEHGIFQEKYGRLECIKGVSGMESPEDITGGYLLEIDMNYRFEDEVSGFVTSREQSVVIKSPQYASEDEVKYIAALYQDMEDAVFAEDGINPYTGVYYTEYIDVDSYARRYVLEEIVKNMDTIYSSQYFYKPADEESTRLMAGPVWDYDKSLGVEEIVADEYDLSDPYGIYASAFGDCNIYRGLCSHEDFWEYSKIIYTLEASNIVKDEINKIDEWSNTNEASVMMDAYRWGEFSESASLEDKKKSYKEEVEIVKNFLEQRDVFLSYAWAY